MPLVVVGVAIGLIIMQANVGLMVILGIFSLAGIIINNAIILIDRIDIERAEGAASDYEAIISASVRRLGLGNDCPPFLLGAARPFKARPLAVTPLTFRSRGEARSVQIWAFPHATCGNSLYGP